MMSQTESNCLEIRKWEDHKLSNFRFKADSGSIRHSASKRSGLGWIQVQSAIAIDFSPINHKSRFNKDSEIKNVNYNDGSLIIKSNYLFYMKKLAPNIYFRTFLSYNRYDE
ncbi:hypothetical protein O6H91_12G050900 [Diphasiastrum complanatum]|uniref:Uncharacterized protein n=1 Tax=Diphasiastrum complanatum TaxID=34168 RepID=A0ACC2C228_DIPCM|nr:hypothetical protein O6H91_12G050900 [Diphasiastrum complanatum]